MELSLQSLLHRLDHLSGQFRELREGVQKAVLVADVDPEMALTRARKVLEYVVRDVYRRRCQEPPGTRPLENLLQRLVKDGHFPDRLDAYANTVRKLGNVGTHTFGEKVTAADVYQSLTQLMPVLEWYFEVERQEAGGQEPAPQPAPATPQPPEPSPVARHEPQMAVVPKGLRSFDAKDADFFLDLLPGPRDKDGLPESIRFWKHRIEERDEPTFTVGVLYGPSGCGKSSLVKAGLLPRLAGNVLSVYVEATGEDTEARLLHGLGRRCPALTADLGLTGALTALRQGQALQPGQKVFLVLDQFEQWLHAKRGEEDSVLTQALRQCDGERVQCVVLVRDDFWMALTRFMQGLHIEVVPGQNTAVVDLFDVRHARKVLTAFGRAFGALAGTLSKDQEAFLDHAVQGLSQEGRVVSVRLALFADMMKARPWTPATLRALGGTAGVGLTFLEETFAAPAAPPRHRLHREAAQAVLKALLPAAGADIKGHMRSYAELLAASGYGSRPRDFEELLRILDSEVRLITPTEPAGSGGGAGEGPAAPDDRYYQLTHDYLVHSLRDWLTRKQKETRRGRAELRLAERAASWTAKPENRHLPAWWEWLNIRLFTRKKDWTPSQRQMMRAAGRHHGARGVALLCLLLLLGWAGYEIYGRLRAEALVESIVTAETADVPRLVEQLPPYRRWADPRLLRYVREAPADSKEHLHASLALVPVEGSQVEYLYQRLLHAGPGELPVIRDALAGHRDALAGRLWDVLGNAKADPDQRFRAACALATYDGQGGRWVTVSPFVTEGLLAAVQQNPSQFMPLLEMLRPVRDDLIPPLSSAYRSRDRSDSERSWATSFLADYAGDPDHLGVLADLLLDGDEKQFALVYPRLQSHGDRGLPLLSAELDRSPSPDARKEEKETQAKRQANAGVALLKMNRPARVWPLFRHRPDPRARSYLIHRLSPLGADPQALVRRFDEEPDTSARRALLLALGEYGENALAPGQRDVLLAKFVGVFQDDPDPGLHGAAEWLLRQWGQGDSLREFEQAWARDQGERVARLKRIGQALSGDGRGQRYWYVNGQGQTMVVLPGPVTFQIGSPSTEAGREGGPEGRMEAQREKRISRSFAIAAKEVTVEQFLEFRRDHVYNKDYSPSGDCPVNTVTWYDAAAYCNWLSGREGIDKSEWCYLPNEEGEYSDGMRLAPDYLHRTGYRLPSEAEWEYACRAGAVTSRYYGEGEELLGRYAWYTKNSQDRGMLPGMPGRFGVPGGRLKPNDFGLFDMLGNAMEWCQDRADYHKPGEDVEGPLEVKDKDNHLWLGGAFVNSAPGVRCASRLSVRPSASDDVDGFRPARTFR